MTGAILAGGKNRRMGFNKAFIEVNGQSIIQGIISTLKHIFSNVMVVANKNNALDYEMLNVRVVTDIYKDTSSLGGIYTALFHSPSQYCFVTACDMPFLNSGIIKDMLASINGHAVVVPYINGRYHPLHAIYSKSCLKPIQEMIEKRDMKITNLYQNIKTRILDEGFFKEINTFSFIENINTFKDLQKISETTEVSTATQSPIRTTLHEKE
jgi:molybdopterin-guanine dinucleotide biosynthesis protein A